MMLALYALLLTGFTIYSYALIDPNLTLINNSIWEDFKIRLLFFGYFNRLGSTIVYTLLVAALFFFHYYIVKNFKNFALKKVFLVVFFTMLFSYPLISHDLFNYMFDAKIITVYGKNPYLLRAMDFPQDSWLQFMHWIHRTYPYGPTFLPLTLIPSFLSFSKLILNFIFFKAFFLGFYLMAVMALNKVNRKMAFFFATNPFVLIEGIANAHNDMIAACLGLVGIYYLYHRDFFARIFFLVSGGIKYLTAPLILLSQTNQRLNIVSLVLTTGLIIYVSVTQEFQPWYFLALFAYLPFFEKLISNMNIFFAGLLFAYVPYVFGGNWTEQTLFQKHSIIAAAAILNLLYFGYLRFVKK